MCVGLVEVEGGGVGSGGGGGIIHGVESFSKLGELPSRKQAYIILTPLNPTFI